MIAGYSKEDLQGCKTGNNYPTFKANKTIETGNTTKQSLTKLLLCPFVIMETDKKGDETI